MSQLSAPGSQNAQHTAGPSLLGPEYLNDEDSNLAGPAAHRKDVPPELRNARPSKGGILARIGAFLFGGGVGGAAAFGLGAGGAVSAALGVGTAVGVGLATGGAAILGGALVFGLFVGIKAIVNHFSKSPTPPEPRITNQALPKNSPADDSFNRRVAGDIKKGVVLTGSLQAAVDNIARKYGKEEGLPIKELIQDEIHLIMLMNDIRDTDGVIDANRLEKILDRYMNGNMQLHDGMKRLELPKEYTDALGSITGNLANNYGKDISPKTAKDLLSFYSPDIGLEPFGNVMQEKIRAHDGKVTPEVLKNMAKEAVAPEMAVRALASAIKKEASKSGVMLTDKAARMAAVDLYKSKERPEIRSLDDARNFVRSRKDLASAATQKNAILHAMSGDESDINLLPAEHRHALQGVVSSLRRTFGDGSLPADMKALLEVKVAAGELGIMKTIREHLQDAAAKGSISPNDFANAARVIIRKVAQEYSMANALAREMESTYKLKLTDAGKLALLNSVANSVNGFMEKVAGMKNAQSATLAINTREVSAKLAEIAANIKNAEKEYLPKVSDDARPMLQSIIRSLPFDARNLPKTNAIVSRNASEMAEWKADIAYGDKNLNAFCNKMTDELNMFANEKRLDHRIENSVFTQIRLDANRSNWSLNNKEMGHTDANTLENEFRSLLPDEKDLAFVTRLSNQYISTRFLAPLSGTWNDSGDNSAGHTAGTGLTTFTNPPDGNDLVRKDHDRSTKYTVSISDDKKTAVIEVFTPQTVHVGNEEHSVVGTITQNMRVTCDLSAGSPNGEPRVVKTEVSQHFEPADFS